MIGRWGLVLAVPVVLAAPAGAAGAACGKLGLAVTLALDAARPAGPGIRGTTLDVAYPADRVRLPATDGEALQQAIENVFDGDGSRGTLLVGANHADEARGARVTVLYSATSDLPSQPRALVRIRFDCQSGTALRGDEFRCVARDVVGETGNPLAGVSCAVLSIAPVDGAR